MDPKHEAIPRTASDQLQGDNLPGGRDTRGHSSVQAWSHGEIFPAVIVIVDSHDQEGTFRYRAYDLCLDGQAERFATHEDAEAAARMLLADPAARVAWREGRE